MLTRLKSLVGKRTVSRPAAILDDTAPRPLRPVYLVGDLHGRADLLERMLELIDADIGATGAADPHLVFLGDYVDFGPDSAEVLARLKELDSEFPDNVTCLMGSHDRMMLDFLADPETRGRRWMRSGAGATLRSFGLVHDPATGILTEMARDLSARLPKGLAEWLAGRPLSWNSGSLWAVHAGADPQHAMADQTARTLLWGHPEFDSVPRADGIWVAHGHARVAEPVFTHGRIALDTGAWETGRLSACAVRLDGSHRFFQT